MADDGSTSKSVTEPTLLHAAFGQLALSWYHGSKFHSLIEFLMKVLSVLLMLNSSKHSSMLVCDTELEAFL